jgi:cytidylate kinase
MQKVLVIGCPGSGKSTFARALCEKTGLPLCHLDMLYWNADRTTVERGVFLRRLQAVLEQQTPGLCRSLSLRTGRYNQDLFSNMLLVEVGSAGNTRQQALVAAEELAEAIIALSHGSKSG